MTDDPATDPAAPPEAAPPDLAPSADPASPAAVPPPPPPRPLTRRVRRRAWADPRVRLWWAAAALTLGLGLYLGTSAFRTWRHERWLMSLPPVTATVDRTDVETVADRVVAPGTTMQLSFAHNGERVAVRLVQQGYSGEPKIGRTVPAHVNPDDPSDVTIRNQPLVLTTVLAGAILMAALAVLPLSAALLARRAVLRTWRLGEARVAAPVGRQQTPLAPGARVVRCAWADDAADRRVFEVFVPGRSPEAAESADAVRVIAPPGRGGRPLAVAWFE